MERNKMDPLEAIAMLAVINALRINYSLFHYLEY